MIWPQHVLDAIAQREYQHPDDPPGKLRKGLHDAPRSMMAHALEGRLHDQPHQWRGTMGGITDNHKGQAEAAMLWATNCAEPHLSWMTEWLGRWLVEGDCLGEQCPNPYDKHHCSHLVMTAAAALRDGKRGLYELAMECLRRWSAVRVACMAPADAHPDVAGRTAIAGRRCGDHLGRSGDRDALLHMLADQPPPRDLRWSADRPEDMELVLVDHLRHSLPKIPLDASLAATTALEDELRVQRFEDGIVTRTPVSTMKTGRGGAIVWDTKMRFSTGEVWSVSWRDPLGLPYNDKEARATGNPRRPVAREMGGGPAPAGPLSTRDLGRPVGPELVIGRRGGSRPAPPAPPPPPGEPEKPTPPTGAPDRYEIAAKSVRTGGPVTLLVGNDRDGNFTIFRETR